MTRLFWAWTDTKRTIPGVALKENETHPHIRTGISFTEGGRILYGPTMAVSRLLAGEVAVGTVRHGEDRLYVWEVQAEEAADHVRGSGHGAEEPGGRRVGLFHPVQRRLFWGCTDACGRALPTEESGAEPHWSLYMGALLLAYDDPKNSDVAEIWPLLQEEWRERGRIGETAASRDALFVINAFLWENRFFYLQDTAQVEPLPTPLPRHIRDRSVELAGKPVPFSWLAAPRGRTVTSGADFLSANDASDARRTDSPTASPLTDHRYALVPDHPWPEDVRALIPRFRPEEVQLPDFLLELADMIHRTRGGRRPLRNLLFYGPPGSGKSTLAQLLAQLLQLPYYYVNLSLNVEEDVLLGKYVPGDGPGRFRFDEPPFVQAFRCGGLVELMELNFARPGVLGAAHSALETPYRLTLANGETVERHPLCIVVATMNLAMVGTQRLNEALKSRFQRKVYVPPLPRDELVEIVASASGLEDRELIGRMADVVEKMQRRVEQEGLPGQVGTRELIDWAQDVRFTGDPVVSAWKTVLPAAALEQRDIQEELAQVLVENVFGFAGDGDG